MNICRYSNIWIFVCDLLSIEYMQICKYSDIWIYANLQIFKYLYMILWPSVPTDSDHYGMKSTNIWIFEYMQIYKYLNIWIYANLQIFEYWYMILWPPSLPLLTVTIIVSNLHIFKYLDIQIFAYLHIFKYLNIQIFDNMLNTVSRERWWGSEDHIQIFEYL